MGDKPQESVWLILSRTGRRLRRELGVGKRYALRAEIDPNVSPHAASTSRRTC